MGLSGMPWVKLYIELIDDPRMGRLAKSERLLFMNLLMLAGECDAEGALVKGEMPLTVEDLSWRLRDPDVEKDLGTLRGAGLVECHDGVLCVHNFANRQGRPQSERRAQWRERQQRRRSSGQPAKEDDGGPEADAGLSPEADAAEGDEAGPAVASADARTEVVRDDAHDGSRHCGRDRVLARDVDAGAGRSGSKDTPGGGAPTDGVTRESEAEVNAVTHSGDGSSEDVTGESPNSPSGVTRDSPVTHGHVTPPEESRGEESRPEERREEPQQSARARASPAAAAAAVYQDNVGLLTPIVAEKLHEAVDAYTEGWVCDAVRIAAQHHAHSWRYVEAILERWKREGKDEGRLPAGKSSGRGPPESDHAREVPASEIRRHNAESARRLEQRAKAAKAKPPPPAHVRVWEQVLASLRLELPKGTFNTYLRDTVAAGCEGGALTVVVGNARAVELLELRLKGKVDAALREVLRDPPGGIEGLVVDRVEWRVKGGEGRDPKGVV